MNPTIPHELADVATFVALAAKIAQEQDPTASIDTAIANGITAVANTGQYARTRVKPCECTLPLCLTLDDHHITIDAAAVARARQERAACLRAWYHQGAWVAAGPDGLRLEK